MIQNCKLGFVGAGQMCEAILCGLLSAGLVPPGQISLTDINQARLDEMAGKYAVNTSINGAGESGAKAMVAACDIVVLAIKPQLAAGVLPQLAAGLIAGQLVVSIIGGLPLAVLQGLLPASPIVRAMPNTPALVGMGCCALVQGPLAGGQHMALCQQLFGAVGSSYVLEEHLMDAFTAISGCGPAFAYLFAEALADGAVHQGLPRALAQQVAAQTLAGAAQMLLQTGQNPAQLKNSVCSPGGGSIAGLHALQQGGFSAAVMAAVIQAKSRMQQLGQGG